MASASTLSEQIFAAMRDEILAGNFLPGAKLKLAELSMRFGVSLSVMRESMTRLAEQNLVQSSPQRGFRVTPLSVEDLLDLTRTRVLIESLTLRESMEHGDLSWESTVLAALHQLQGTPLTTDDGRVSYEWVTAHSFFHQRLLAGCGSTRLVALAMNLRDCSELYRHWSHELAGDVDRDIPAEHSEIAELTIAREPRATQALADHIQRTTSALIAGADRSADHRMSSSAPIQNANTGPE